MVSVDTLWAANDLDAMFPAKGLNTVSPFPRARRLRARLDYDPAVVETGLRTAQPIWIDPRFLSSNQGTITRQGVAHYTSERRDQTFRDGHQRGNQTPVVYKRDDEAIILSGNHRAAAALLEGTMLKALVIEGPWGPDRGR